MSVINNVLKELDTPSSVFSSLDAAPEKSSPRPPSNRFRFGIVLAVVLLLIVVVLLLLHFNGQDIFRLADNNGSERSVSKAIPTIPATASAPVSTVQSVNAARVPKVEPAQSSLVPTPPLPPVAEAQAKQAVTGLQISEQPQSVVLSLQLEPEAQTFLRQQQKNRYTFLITNSQKKIIVPSFEQSRWLRQVGVRSTAQGTELQFVTADGVLVSSEPSRHVDYYSWQIRLRKPLKTAPVASVQTNPEPSPTQGDDSVQGIVAEKTSIEKTAKPMTPLAKAKPEVKLQIKPASAHLDAEQKYQRALQFARQGKSDQARQQLEELLGGKIDYQARIKLLDVLQKNGQRSAWLKLLEASLSRYPQNAQLQWMDAGFRFAERQYDVLLQRYSAETQDKQILNYVAAASQQQKDYPTAIRAYRQSLLLDPAQPRNWVSLGIAYEQQKQFREALQAYRQAQQDGALNRRLSEFVNNRISQLSGAG